MGGKNWQKSTSEGQDGWKQMKGKAKKIDHENRGKWKPKEGKKAPKETS
jgi:hypothetical protein